MNKKLRTIFVWGGILIVISGLVIYKVYRSRRHQPSAPKTTPGQLPPVSVNAYVVKPQKIEELVLSTGTVLANEEISVQPEISGRITQLYFKDGNTVQAGSLLVKLFDEDLQAQLRKLQLQEELAKKNESRLKELLKSEAVSQQEYDIALNQLHTVQADMDLLKANIRKTEIRAPFTGRVGLRNVSVGAIVSPSTIITTLQQVQPVRIDFSVPERYLPALNAQAEIHFTVEGIDQVFTAPVTAIEPRIDESTRTVKIRALYKNQPLQVFPGAFAEVRLPLRDVENGIMIPTEAIIPELKGQKVFLSRNGKAFPQPVEIGMRNDSTVQVMKGLTAGDTVIVTGILQLRPNSPLRITAVK